MNLEQFIIIGMFLFVPVMYGISILWYFFISKKRGIYIIEILLSLGSLVGIIVLVIIGYQADVGNALAALFSALFLIPVLIGALLAALFVKITLVYINKK